MRHCILFFDFGVAFRFDEPVVPTGRRVCLGVDTLSEVLGQCTGAEVNFDDEVVVKSSSKSAAAAEVDQPDESGWRL